MTPEQRQIVDEGLSVFNAKLTEDCLIQKGNRVIPSIKIKAEKGRLRFENRMTGALVASGLITSVFAKSFCKKFWYWEEVK